MRTEVLKVGLPRFLAIALLNSVSLRWGPRGARRNKYPNQRRQKLRMIEGIKHFLLVSLVISASLSVFSAASVPVQGESVTFSDDFSSDTGLWKYWGTAYREVIYYAPPTDFEGYVVLTCDQAQAGAVWFKHMFRGNFTVSFKYKITDGNSTTDSFGMVVMFLKERYYAKWDTKWGRPVGGYMGFSYPIFNLNDPCYGYGVEFDGFKDDLEYTPSSHIALIKDSTQNHLEYVDVDVAKIRDGNWHDAKIVVEGSSVTVYIDSGEVASWSISNIVRTYGCFGFSGGTSSYGRSILIDDFSITIEGSYEEYVPSIFTTYIDPRQQTDVRFGEFSFWHQPWRAYMDTWPVSWLLDSTGINFSATSDNTLEEVDAVAKHLEKNGFKHARVEVGWGLFDYINPSKLDPDYNYEQSFENILTTLKKYNIRPLILLNANHGVPCPIKSIQVQLMQDAHSGDTQVKLDSNNAELVNVLANGLLTGFSNLTEYWACEVPITDYDPQTGKANLNQLLPSLPERPSISADTLPAGTYYLHVLKYLPFKWQADGSPAPGWETLDRWVEYVSSVAGYAKDMLDTEGEPDAGFDFEVWNELTFGSYFLNIQNYDQHPPPGADWKLHGGREIPKRTVKFVKDLGNNLPGVRVGDGFSNQTPFPAGSTEPKGLDALDKHPYAGRRIYPEQIPPHENLDAYGEPPGIGEKPWVPSLTVLFPEYYLTTLRTEHICRDISPITTDIYGDEHGRFTYNVSEGGTPEDTENMWVTEVNIAPGEWDRDITPAEAMHIKAKTTLRYLVSFNHKGIERIYFFQGFKGEDENLGMVSENFFEYVHANQSYPVNDVPYTSEVMRAVRNLMAYMGKTNVPVTQTRQLGLLRIEEPVEQIVFEGDGTWAHPTVYNRDVFAFFPYQADERTFLIPYYVMTRDVMHIHDINLPAGDPERYDMEPESFILTIGNVKGYTKVDTTRVDTEVEAYDPLLNSWVPVTVLGRGTNSIKLMVEATDYPRILRLCESPVEVEVPVPVGGVAVPINKFELLAPWIILAALFAIATVSVAVYWRRRQQKA